MNEKERERGEGEEEKCIERQRRAWRMQWLFILGKFNEFWMTNQAEFISNKWKYANIPALLCFCSIYIIHSILNCNGEYHCVCVWICELFLIMVLTFEISDILYVFFKTWNTWRATAFRITSHFRAIHKFWNVCVYIVLAT